MKYIVNTSNDPAYNIALEAYAFRELVNEDELFILWINRPAIIVGKHQNTIQEINKEYTDAHGIKVVRRLSGGGAVYHDLNNLNYTIISNKADEGAFDFKTFSQPVIATLADLGVKAEFTGRNDLEIDGKKFCGNAQAYYKGRMMHHGCLLFDVDMSVLGQALKVSKDKIESKGVKSVRARVTNIVDELPEKITVNEFSDKILEKMKEFYPDMTEYVLSEDELAKIQESYEKQFNTWDWTYGQSPEYTVERNVRYTAGKISTYANVENSIIKSVKIYGDFFGIGDVSDIEDLLVGVPYEYEDVLAKLKTIDTTHYFSRMTTEEVAKAFTPGSHGTTFGGHPVCCAAALAEVGELLDRDLAGNAKKVGDYFAAKLEKLPRVKEVRHQGLLVGVEFDDTISGVDVKHGAFDRKMLITAIGAHIIRMVPPLIVSEEECDKAFEILDETVKSLS